MIINTKPQPQINHPVDFGWYSSETTTLLSGNVNGLTIPGITTLSSSLTTPANTTTAFTIAVTDATTFVGGAGINDAGTSYTLPPSQYPVPISTLYVVTESQWALIGYTSGPTNQAPISGNTFSYCFVIAGTSGGTNLTFSSGSQIYDPRWVTQMVPLSVFETTNITFDAIDNANLGLPNSKNAGIVSYHWDLGNGTTADGPVVETAYWYTGNLNQAGIAAPTQVEVTLTAVSITGQVYYVTHPIIFSQLYSTIGSGNPNVVIGPAV